MKLFLRTSYTYLYKSYLAVNQKGEGVCLAKEVDNIILKRDS